MSKKKKLLEIAKPSRNSTTHFPKQIFIFYQRHQKISQ